MTAQPNLSLLAISIDAGTPQAAQQMRSAVVPQGVPAVWGVSHFDNVAGMAPRGAQQEIALMAPETKLQGAAQSKDLCQRIDNARSQGVVVSSVIVRGENLSHLDWLADQGVNMIADCNMSADTRVRPLRSNLWLAPAAILIADNVKWGTVGAAKKTIRKAIAEGAPLHLHLAGPKLNTQGWGAAASIVRFAAQRAQQGLVKIATFSQVAERLMPSQQRARAQSVLRVA